MLRLLLCCFSSPPSRSLPRRCRAPTEKEQIAKLWGKTVAASDRCEFKLKGKALTIRTAGEPARNAFWGGGPVTMPHVTRTVTGDFEATVKIAAAAAPERTAKYEHGWCASRAGLIHLGWRVWCRAAPVPALRHE